MLNRIESDPDSSRLLLEQWVPCFASGSVLCGEGSALISGDLDRLDGHAADMPDAILYDAANDRLLVVDFATHRGVIDEGRVQALEQFFQSLKQNRVYVTVFQSRSGMAEHTQLPAWGTHAWFAEEPDRMLHFGSSFDN